MNDSSRPTMSDFQHNVLSFASAATGRALNSIWHDGQSVYGAARNVVVRTASAVTYSAAGAALGALTGFLIRDPDRGPESERDRLLRTVRNMQMVREAVPMVSSALSSLEYDARKRLEEMGYYPCEDCGVPHVKDEPHQMPPGTYWWAEQNRYVRPNDADWTREGYEAASDERWDLEDEDNEGGGEQFH